MAAELTAPTLPFSWAQLFPRGHIQKTDSYKNSSRLVKAGLGEGKFQTKKSLSKKVNSFPSLHVD